MAPSNAPFSTLPPSTPPERIAVKTAELGEGLTIGRALPSRQRRMVGAWCFLDHIGPIDFSNKHGLHVGAHPHTCLQTFTWMIEGQLLHRDSLGSEQVIRPGQVNLMTAGHGIVHTEDSLPDSTTLHAAQLWIALPPEHADIAPAFDHYPTLPTWQADGLNFTLLAGSWGQQQAPTRLYSPLVGLDLTSQQVGRTVLPLRPDFEYGLLPLAGTVHIDGKDFTPSDFAYLGIQREQLTLELASDSRCLLLGGRPFENPITMWWNFVGHSQALVAQAQRDWENGAPRFGRVVGDDNRRLTAPPLPWRTA